MFHFLGSVTWLAGMVKNTIDPQINRKRGGQTVKMSGTLSPNSTNKSTKHWPFSLSSTNWSGSPISLEGVLCGYLENWLLTSLIEGCHSSERMAEAECHVPNALWWSHLKAALQEDTEGLLFDTWKPHPTHTMAHEKAPRSVGLTSRRRTELDTGGGVPGKYFKRLPAPGRASVSCRVASWDRFMWCVLFVVFQVRGKQSQGHHGCEEKRNGPPEQQHSRIRTHQR